MDGMLKRSHDLARGVILLSMQPIRFLLYIFCLLSTAFVHAQQTQVRVKVSNDKNEALPFATVTVFSVPDTMHKWEKISDSTGLAVFQLSQGHPYLVRVSSVNYKPVEKNITVKGDNPLYTLITTPQSTAMTGVVVTASKPLMRQEDDKTIVDPEVLAATSTNAYEILEKTPGLFVDQDGNIYLSSTTPAIVYVNGREQKMSAADIATMLKNLPPNAIASIEILRTPSAKYDASGSGGIVNVILRKGVRIGLTGSVTAGMNQGKYGNRFLGLNLNNNNGQVSTYLNLQYGNRNSFEHIQTDRKINADSLLSQDASTKYSGNNFYFGYGVSFQLHRKWELSYDGRFSYNNVDNNSINYSGFAGIGSSLPSYINRTDVRNNGNNYNITQGGNVKYKIDSLGSEWTTDVSYTYSPNSTSQTFNTGDGQLDNKLQFFSAQTNLLKKLNRNTTLETGLKTTGVRFSNQTDYYKTVGGSRTEDPVRSGAYKYNENINSAYLQASRNFSGVILKVGTRMENTNMQGKQEAPRDTSFSVQRNDFFPYVYLSKTIRKIAGYDLRAYLVYRRTISRPAYEYLNPSLRFIDPFLYETGNPSLKPQFTKNYEANISVDERPIVAFGYNDTKDIFTQVIYPSDTSSKISLRTYDNLGSNKETYIRLMAAIPPGKRYFFVVVGQYNHNYYNGLYENKALSYKKGSWTVFTYQLFKLTPLTQLSINGFVRFNGQQQFYELSTFGEARFSVTQQLLQKKLSLTVSLNDIFKTNKNEFTIDQGSIHATGVREGDTRRFGINLRYNFGIKKREDNNMFNVESPEKQSKP
jgi:iron complex outermembrane receptor protein